MEKLTRAINYMVDNPQERETHNELLLKRFEKTVETDRDWIKENKEEFDIQAIKTMKLLLPLSRKERNAYGIR
jgi:hypothetical protein